MKLPGWTSALSLAGWATVVACAVIAGFILWWLVIGGPAHDRLEAAKAHAASVVAAGDTKAAQDAVGVVAGQAKADAATDAVTRKNADAIDRAKGADVPVDPDLNRAGRLSLCGRKIYRNSPECKSLLDAAP